MKHMKRIFVAVLAVSLCVMLAACGDSKEESSEIANPMEQVNEQGLIETTGIDMPAPEGATDVEYYIIKGDTPMGEMRFTLDGKKAYLRSVETDLTSLIGEEGDADKIPEVKDYSELPGDISGLHYEWDAFGSQDIQNRSGYCLMKDDVGFVAWLDVVPGILYNLCMEEDADMDTLVSMAEKIFVPLQGED